MDAKNMDEFHLPPDLFFEVRDIADLKWRRRLKRLTDVLSSFRLYQSGAESSNTANIGSQRSLRRQRNNSERVR
jgi:hypothetical protein